jgi:hypothetical protein
MKMRSFHWCLLIGGLLLVAAACSPSGPQPDAPDGDGQGHHGLDGRPQRGLFVGIGRDDRHRSRYRERAPRTNEDWTTLRRHAIPLVEATNLLQMPGRHVAKPGEKSENPGIELGPEEIEVRINQDRGAFIDFAHKLHDAVAPALTAIENKDVKGLSDAGEDR